VLHFGDVINTEFVEARADLDWIEAGTATEVAKVVKRFHDVRRRSAGEKAMTN
jgi:hypothetical protein